jgi:hypothetical protein
LSGLESEEDCVSRQAPPFHAGADATVVGETPFRKTKFQPWQSGIGRMSLLIAVVAVAIGFTFAELRRQHLIAIAEMRIIAAEKTTRKATASQRKMKPEIEDNKAAIAKLKKEAQPLEARLNRPRDRAEPNELKRLKAEIESLGTKNRQLADEVRVLEHFLMQKEAHERQVGFRAL